LFFRGLAPYNNNAGAGINAFVTEDWSATNGGTRLRVFTTPNGSVTKQVHVSFEQNGRTFFGGNVGVNSFTSASYPLTVNGDTFGWAHVNTSGSLKSYCSLASDNARLYLRNAAGTDKVILNTNGDSTIDSKLNIADLNISNLPTSSAGLSAGDVWSNSGILTIV
jgi:hypothetical protein